MLNKGHDLKKIIKWFNNIIFAFLVTVIVIISFILITSKIAGDSVPKIGNYSLMVVLSGSMSPVFEAGDVIAVSLNQKNSSYREGDIITFKDLQDADKIITHRVIEVVKNNNQIGYRTKGDANNTPDQEIVPSGNVIGQEKWRIPYLGRVTEFAKTKQGFILFIIVPGVLIIISELRKLSQLVNEEVKEKEQEAIIKPWSNE